MAHAEDLRTKKIFIPDTNVILFSSTCIYKFEEHDVVLPIQVIGELDNFKKGYDEINYNAREFCRIIDEISDEQIFNGGIKIGENLGLLKIALKREWHPTVAENLRDQKVDDEIINIAYWLKEECKDTKVIIVSKDVNLRLKAKSLGIIAEDFLSETVQDLNILYPETRTLSVKPKFLDQIFSEKAVNYSLNDVVENEYFILNPAEKRSGLAKYQNNKLHLVDKKIKPFGLSARNNEQYFSTDALLDPSISLVALEGKAGSGKTLFALACGLAQLSKDKYDKVYFTRQTISMGNHADGFLPGDIEAKISPFMKGMYDNLEVLKSIHANHPNIIDGYQKNGELIIEPLGYIRGRTLPRIFFIIDEAQNLTPKEVKTIVTRAGEGTKVIFLGDTKQIDHPYLDQRSNGLSYLIQKFRGQECYSHVHLINSERSELAELASELL